MRRLHRLPEVGYDQVVTLQILTDSEVRITCRFGPGAGLALGDLVANVNGLSSLLSFLTYIESYEQGGSFVGYYRKSFKSAGSIRTVEIDENLNDVDRWDAIREEVARTAVVERISYQSPLEIVIAVSGGFGLVVMSAQRLLTLFNHYNESRAVKAKTDAQVAAYKQLQRELEESKTPGSAQLLLASGVLNLAETAQAMSALESVEVQAPSTT